MKTIFDNYEKEISHENKYFPRNYVLRIEQELLEDGLNEFEVSVYKRENEELLEILKVAHTELEELLDVIIKNLRINSIDKSEMIQECQWIRDKSSNWKRIIN